MSGPAAAAQNPSVASGPGLRIDAADLVATCGADVTLADLHAALAAQRVWLPLDGPHAGDTPLGRALESGAPGPLAALFGAPRDQVLGASFVAGGGTLVKSGGRVVKNVAGFDLAKLVIGGRGEFGRLREVHLRLRAVPEADRTVALAGSRELLEIVTARLMTGGAMLAAFEVINPSLARAMGLGGEWLLLARAMGTAPGVDEELRAAAGLAGDCRRTEPAAGTWERWRESVGAWPVRVRVGADPSTWSEAVAIAARLGASDFSVTVPRGTVRASFAVPAPGPIAALREAAAGRGWPVTVEHADEATLEAAGAWGALNEGSARLIERLRATFGGKAVGR